MAEARMLEEEVLAWQASECVVWHSVAGVPQNRWIQNVAAEVL